MSREFHWCERSYLHTVLAKTEWAREKTGEPVADAIRDLLIALAPIEYAVASHQACDSGLDRVVLQSAKSKETIRDATNQLNHAIKEYDNIVNRIVKEAVLP
jgi:iron uptake system EfeUOB component EfeO/EfeM